MRHSVLWIMGLVLLGVALSSGAPVSAASASRTVSAAGITTGYWQAVVPLAAQPDIIIPPETSCPPNTTYSGSNAEYSCVATVSDGSGHIVWVRQGNSSFGYQHFLGKHNLYLGPVTATVANNLFGLQQSNGRYLYEDYYQTTSGSPSQYVLVFESRNTAPVSDRQEVGVITAYCQGPGHSFEAKCPNWVNQTL